MGSNHPLHNVVMTIPHAGETVPPEAKWLSQTDESVLLTDVDRFVDDIYEPLAKKAPLPILMTEVHRYAADLNRYPTDVDWGTVEKINVPDGTHLHGFHWKRTTTGTVLMPNPIPASTHRKIVEKYHDPFHAALGEWITGRRNVRPDRPIFHFDCHSMPSTGNKAHADPGGKRADVVLSDREGKSCSPAFLKIVKEELERAQLKVAINDPYKGGRITERYGLPLSGHQTLQIELNRALYMNESTKAKLAGFESFRWKMVDAILRVLERLNEI